MNTKNAQELKALKIAMASSTGIINTDNRGFMKFDTQKPMFHLIDPVWHESVAKVLTAGAQKYEENNWKKNKDPNRYISALERHLNAIKRGEFIDAETGELHTANISCNAMFLHYMLGKKVKR